MYNAPGHALINQLAHVMQLKALSHQTWPMTPLFQPWMTPLMPWVMANRQLLQPWVEPQYT
jgi:hypothetical protein